MIVNDHWFEGAIDLRWSSEQTPTGWYSVTWELSLLIHLSRSFSFTLTLPPSSSQTHTQTPLSTFLSFIRSFSALKSFPAFWCDSYSGDDVIQTLKDKISDLELVNENNESDVADLFLSLSPLSTSSYFFYFSLLSSPLFSLLSPFSSLFFSYSYIMSSLFILIIEFLS